MSCILLVRHGHVAGIVPKRFRGQLDIPLSEEGRMQAQQAAQFISQRYAPAVVYSSPLQRCRDSAMALTAKLGLPAPTVSAHLTDTSYGTWQGKLATEVAAESPELFEQWQSAPESLVFPGGESLPRVAARALPELTALAQRHLGQTLVIYTHDSVIRVALLSILGAPLSTYHRIEVGPCCVNELQFESNGSFELVRVNERTA
jgi:probable phosphoglycerate mutase